MTNRITVSETSQEPQPTTGSGLSVFGAQDSLLPYDITVDRGTFTLQGQRYEYRRVADERP